MNEQFVVDLPLEANNTQFEIISYPIKLRQAVEAVLDGRATQVTINHVDLSISNGRQSALIRVFPGPFITREVEAQPSLFFISGVGLLLTLQHVETDTSLEVGGQFRIDPDGRLQGTITVWRQETDQVQLLEVS